MYRITNWHNPHHSSMVNEYYILIRDAIGLWCLFDKQTKEKLATFRSRKEGEIEMSKRLQPTDIIG